MIFSVGTESAIFLLSSVWACLNQLCRCRANSLRDLSFYKTVTNKDGSFKSWDLLAPASFKARAGALFVSMFSLEIRLSNGAPSNPPKSSAIASLAIRSWCWPALGDLLDTKQALNKNIRGLSSADQELKGAKKGLKNIKAGVKAFWTQINGLHTVQVFGRIPKRQVHLFEQLVNGTKSGLYTVAYVHYLVYALPVIHVASVICSYIVVVEAFTAMVGTAFKAAVRELLSELEVLVGGAAEIVAVGGFSWVDLVCDLVVVITTVLAPAVCALLNMLDLVIRLVVAIRCRRALRRHCRLRKHKIIQYGFDLANCGGFVVLRFGSLSLVAHVSSCVSDVKAYFAWASGMSICHFGGLSYFGKRNAVTRLSGAILLEHNLASTRLLLRGMMWPCAVKIRPSKFEERVSKPTEPAPLPAAKEASLAMGPSPAEVKPSTVASFKTRPIGVNISEISSPLRKGNVHHKHDLSMYQKQAVSTPAAQSAKKSVTLRDALTRGGIIKHAVVAKRPLAATSFSVSMESSRFIPLTDFTEKDFPSMVSRKGKETVLTQRVAVTPLSPVYGRSYATAVRGAVPSRCVVGGRRLSSVSSVSSVGEGAVAVGGVRGENALIESNAKLSGEGEVAVGGVRGENALIESNAKLSGEGEVAVGGVR
ncbi:hypothetical protein HDU98_009940, partial [Podochytrium sp. JEL0797]